MPRTEMPPISCPPPGRDAIRTYLDMLFARIDAAQPPELPTTLISGAIRCGKTRVAQRLAAATGLVRLETDEIRNALVTGLSERDKRRVVKYVYRRLLMRFPRGLLVDGTALMDDPCELPLWARRRGLLFFTIGYSEGSVADKTRDLLAFRAQNRCWTHKAMDDAGVPRLARQIIRRSKQLQTYCAAHDLPYHHLDSGQFYRERDRIAAEIERIVRARDTDAPSGLMARLKLWR